MQSSVSKGKNPMNRVDAQPNRLLADFNLVCRRIDSAGYLTAFFLATFAARRGRFQYGLLHLGQTRGSCSESRGSH
jgi:hypothetical protein